MADIALKIYDLVILGATGYTGKLCAEYVSTSLPTELKWAVAGRSEKKLLAVVDELKAMSTDRLQPGQFPVFWNFRISLTLKKVLRLLPLTQEN